MDFEKQVQEAVSLVHQYPTAINKALVAECVGLLDDIHAEIQEQIADGKIKFNTDVVIKIDGQTVKFQNEDDFAEWLHGIID